MRQIMASGVIDLPSHTRDNCSHYPLFSAVPPATQTLGYDRAMHKRIFRRLGLVAWFFLPGTVLAAPYPDIHLTPEEQAYLDRAGTIRMCVDPDWVPFEQINAQGQHEGIAADLVQLAANRVGLKIELYPVKTWEESLAASKNKQCQVMSFLNQTAAREQWLIFTQPIFFDQNVIVTREEHPYIGDPKALTEHVVVMPRGTMIEERLRSDYPRLRVITTATEAEAMTLVSERKADMTIRSLIVAAYEIKKKGLFNLKISGQIPEYANQLRIGVLKNEPILRDILNKGVGTITVQEREAIANQHVLIKVQQGIDYTLVWQVIAGSGLIMLLVLAWNRKLTALNNELARLSVTDTLTGLFNRLKTDEVLIAEFKRSMRSDHPFSVILVDIDHFKHVNDTYGHQVGDQVLITVAKTLQTNTRGTDVLGRWGGEEFIIVSPHTDQIGAVKLAENLRQSLQDQNIPRVQQITASFGVATYRSSDQPKDLVARADAALYEAKRQGRNRVEAT
jgi:diguanylate cyclase (GGDEF)-like protein